MICAVSSYEFEIMFGEIHNIYEGLIYALSYFSTFFLITLIIGLIITYKRDVSFKTKPKYLIAFTSEIAKERVFQIIIRYALQSNCYILMNIYETDCKIILSDSSFYTINNLDYGIYFSSIENNLTRVEIGAKRPWPTLNKGIERRLRLLQIRIIAALLAEGDHPIVDKSNAV